MGTSNYAGVKGVGFRPYVDAGVLFHESNIQFRDILDGQSNTFAIGEVTVESLPHVSLWAGTPTGTRVGCLATTRLPPNRVALPNDRRRVFGSRHPGGALFALCDGSVWFIEETIDSREPVPSSSMPYRPGVYQALSTRAGGETVSLQ